MIHSEPWYKEASLDGSLQRGLETLKRDPSDWDTLEVLMREALRKGKEDEVVRELSALTSQAWGSSRDSYNKFLSMLLHFSREILQKRLEKYFPSWDIHRMGPKSNYLEMISPEGLQDPPVRLVLLPHTGGSYFKVEDTGGISSRLIMDQDRFTAILLKRDLTEMGVLPE